MASVFKKEKRKGAPWYIDYFDEFGKRIRVKGCADKGVTEQIARKLESDVELRRRGVIDPRDTARTGHAARPLATHLDDFHAHLVAKGGTAKHADMTRERTFRLAALVRGAAVAAVIPPRAIKEADRVAFVARAREFVARGRLADLTPDRVQAALGMLRDSGLSLDTANHYRSAIKSFARWAWRSGRTIDDALAGVTGFNAKEDRRHDRRAISVPELQRLIAAAQGGADYRRMTGPARALCYRLAVATGLRLAEIATIRPESFALGGNRPSVTVAAGYTKNGDVATQPLPADLAADLAVFVAGMPRGAVVFPLPDRGADMIRLDLEAAGIAYRDADGRVFDFHALRGMLATLADQNGVSPRVVQRLMRHSTLDLTGRYTRPRAADLDSAVAALPGLAPRDREAIGLASTGTDPTSRATASATATGEERQKPLRGKEVVANGTRIHKPRVAGSNPAAAISA